jgi:hypothetical protein
MRVEHRRLLNRLKQRLNIVNRKPVTTRFRDCTHLNSLYISHISRILDETRERGPERRGWGEEGTYAAATGRGASGAKRRLVASGPIFGHSGLKSRFFSVSQGNATEYPFSDLGRFYPFFGLGNT